MGKPVVLSADSTCDLNEELKEQLHVHYYPLHIIWHGHDYLDNVDITTDEIFAGYYDDGSLPKTAAVNTQEYLEHFKQFVDEGCEVVHLNLGSSLSSSYEHACEAASQLGGVHVVDSQNLSTGIGLELIYAARWIEEGKSAAEVAALVEGMRQRVHSSFVLDTMDFLAAGGRCPSIMAHVGKALKLRLQINVNNADGSMRVGKLYRGSMKRVLAKYTRDTLAKYSDIVHDHIFVTTTGTLELAQEVADLVRTLGPFEHIHLTKASCTIGSHCGPNCLGVLFVTES